MLRFHCCLGYVNLRYLYSYQVTNTLKPQKPYSRSELCESKYLKQNRRSRLGFYSLFFVFKFTSKRGLPLLTPYACFCWQKSLYVFIYTTNSTIFRVIIFNTTLLKTNIPFSLSPFHKNRDPQLSRDPSARTQWPVPSYVKTRKKQPAGFFYYSIAGEHIGWLNHINCLSI